ncbi:MULTISPECIES: Dna2/Cas4 domain-containing protein [Bacillus subtilis group]|uniref:Dna2/Cas4 domain-containing protein n=1 Tax=Bacillus subtilis group TaxID=653685 RepID=UPI001BA432E8|nr:MULTISPECIES: Dna2/Cas4 domain-containing protein [Bacillus subtilis group]MEC2189675.1 Dna2/Cas4 domain-containing protein [Bacillus spizizenii]MEC2297044.1 Dna2/Cas4 domain-containing protein [Bacillus subtilis]CAF1784826.1 hypothetical protein NRS6107_04042 [Bacillus subtilis]CAI6329881.1 Dna2/Cas4 domain-containing protein [Bacillus subtilis]
MLGYILFLTLIILLLFMYAYFFLWKGKLIYTDNHSAKTFVSKQFNLDGRPDYIYFKYGVQLIPWELKHKLFRGKKQNMGDIMQLAAYFLLIEETYKKRPRYGILEYKNKKLLVWNTKHLRRKLIRQIDEMAEYWARGHVRYRPTKRLCQKCGHNQICTYKKK